MYNFWDVNYPSHNLQNFPIKPEVFLPELLKAGLSTLNSETTDLKTLLYISKQIMVKRNKQSV